MLVIVASNCFSQNLKFYGLQLGMNVETVLSIIQRQNTTGYWSEGKRNICYMIKDTILGSTKLDMGEFNFRNNRLVSAKFYIGFCWVDPNYDSVCENRAREFAERFGRQYYTKYGRSTLNSDNSVAWFVRNECVSLYAKPDLHYDVGVGTYYVGVCYQYRTTYNDIF